MAKLQTTRDVMRHILPYIRGRTVDVGAGTAKYKGLIATRASDYVAFDMHPGPHIDAVGDIESLPFPDGAFDTVICNQVLEHVSHPWLVVRELYRVAKPGGVCVLTAPFLAAFHKDPEDYFRYTHDGLVSIFRDAGFIILESDVYTPLWTTIVQFIEFAYFSPYERRVGRMGERFLRFLLLVAKFLDRYFSKRHLIYGNSYIIAKKT